MKIDIDQAIKDSGSKITKLELAQKAFEAGCFNSRKSAINMLNYNIQGKAKGLDDQLLIFLAGYFNMSDCDFYCKYCNSNNR